jgi:predicted alpha-1,2-mannosidase
MASIALGHEKKLVNHVNPLIGTDSSYRLSNGNTYPAITLPFGMTAWTPQTAEERWIYTYQADSIQGIRATHQPSPWISDYGDFSIMPMVGELIIDPRKRASKFDHRNESVLPHYYRVLLDRYQITAEVTASMRCGQMRFTFPQSENSFILIDTHPRGGYVKIIPEERKIIGYSLSNYGGTPENFACYFVAKFDKSFSRSGIWTDDRFLTDSSEKKGDHVIAYISFTTKDNDAVQLTVATSFISFEQAERNLKNEIGENDFDKTKNEADKAWEKELKKIEIKGASEDQKTTFYTAFYRCLIFPRIWYEVDEMGQTQYFSPFDGQIHSGIMYTDTGFWDTFRALFPFYTILYPRKDAEIIQSLLNAYDEGGWLPKWMSPGYRGSMIGTHSASVIADAYLKGIHDFDEQKAYEAMVKDAMVKSDIKGQGRNGIEYYTQLGYVPADKVKEATARTLEFAYDDFCVAQMASALKRDKDGVKFLERSRYYINVYDSSAGFMRGRNFDGNWVFPFDPIEWGGPYTEGNAWHYSWFVPHDIQGLMDLYGGKDDFAGKLDEFFRTTPHFKVGSYDRVIHEMIEMVRANMGQYAHGNEPVHHVSYLYNYAGQPWKTQMWVRRIMDELYGPGPDGLCGDEDNGQMSAWYILSALGFYPVCPGKPLYDIGSPLFKEVTISLPNGNNFFIVASDNSQKNRYIQSLKLNGKEHQNTWLSHSDILKGGKLEFQMGEQPNKSWGNGGDN